MGGLLAGSRGRRAVPMHARAEDDKGSAPAEELEAIEITARPIAHFERGRPDVEAVRRAGVPRRAGARPRRRRISAAGRA